MTRTRRPQVPAVPVPVKLRRFCLLDWPADTPEQSIMLWSASRKAWHEIHSVNGISQLGDDLNLMRRQNDARMRWAAESGGTATEPGKPCTRLACSGNCRLAKTG